MVYSYNGLNILAITLPLRCQTVHRISGFRTLFNTELAYKQLNAELEFLSLAMRKLKAKT